MNLQNAGVAKKNANTAQKLPNMLRFSYSFLFLQHYSHAQAQNHHVQHHLRIELVAVILIVSVY